jgi:hypothetical protein
MRLKTLDSAHGIPVGQGFLITVFKGRAWGTVSLNTDMIVLCYFLQDYIRELLKAKYEDGCQIIGYTAWSLIDNFQWEEGYE